MLAISLSTKPKAEHFNEKKSIEHFYTNHTEKLCIFVIHKHTVKHMIILCIHKLL